MGGSTPPAESEVDWLAQLLLPRGHEPGLSQKNTFIIEYGIFSEDGTRCPRKAPANSQAPAFMGNWEWRGFKDRGTRV